MKRHVAKFRENIEVLEWWFDLADEKKQKVIAKLFDEFLDVLAGDQDGGLVPSSDDNSPAHRGEVGYVSSFSHREMVKLAFLLKNYFPELGTDEEMEGADVIENLAGMYSCLPQGAKAGKRRR